MNIAVLMGGVGFDTQKRMINGILDSALPEGTNVYIFTCDGWYYASRFKYENGEYNIYNLPDFTQYDGVITNLETIHDVKIREALIEKIKKAGVPCASMVVKIDGAINIWMENESGIRAIVEHLVEEHHARKIFYISGPVESQDAEDRLNAYRRASEQYGLAWDDRMVAYGDYTYKSGIHAVNELLQKDMPLPDAVMAANDDMAIGAVLAFKEAGYQVPEDILVTGYDNSSIAQLNHPRLTTVRRGEYAAAEIAYKTLIEAIRGENPQMEHIVCGKPLFSQSCGCDKKQSYTHAELQEMYVKKSVEVDDNLELLKCCAAEFTGLETFDDFKECTQQYIRLLSPDYFYLCMCGSIENYFDELERMAEGKERGRDETVYTEDIWVPLAYENGVFNSYDGFHRNELLPPSCKSGREGNFYLVMPLHHQEYCFGYCVVGNYRPALEGRFFRHFILSLDNALETVRRQDTMNAMLGRLSKMWLYDELTGVNNRAGYNKFAPRILEEAQKKQLPIAVIFADMDGLKKVNDLYGHEEGDAYIKAMANILEHNRRHGELLARYGGDEFVIVLNGYSEDGIREYVVRIKNAIDQYNARYTRAYKLDASIGYFLETDAEKASLEVLVELADRNMYRIKREKKAAQKKQN